MAGLFDRNQAVISRHISNIFRDNELDKMTSLHFLQNTNKVGRISRTVTLYNLDVIISVGFRVNSKRGIVLENWHQKY